MRLTIKDFDYVYSILSHDEVWPFVTDDITRFCDKEKLVREILSSNQIVAVDYKRNGIIGIFNKRSSIIWDAHQQSLPELTGKDRLEATKYGISWMFKNTACQKVIGLNPRFLRHVTKMANLCGMKIEGAMSKSFLYNASLHDQVLTGITKDEWMTNPIYERFR